MKASGYFEYDRDGTRREIAAALPPDVYFDDAPAPEPEPERSDVDRLRVVFAVMKEGRKATIKRRLLALEYVFGLSPLTMREAAEEAGCELKTFFDSVRKIQQLLRGKI